MTFNQMKDEWSLSYENQLESINPVKDIKKLGKSLEIQKKILDCQIMSNFLSDYEHWRIS